MYAPPAITVSVLTKPSISYTVLPLYLWSMKCFLFTSSNSMHFLKRQTYMIQKASPDCGPSPSWHPFMILILLLCSTFDTDVKLFKFNYKIKVCLRPLLLKQNTTPHKVNEKRFTSKRHFWSLMASRQISLIPSTSRNTIADRHLGRLERIGKAIVPCVKDLSSPGTVPAASHTLLRTTLK